MKIVAFIFGFTLFLNLWNSTNELKCYFCAAAQEFCNKLEEIECKPEVKECFSQRIDEGGYKSEIKNCLISTFAEIKGVCETKPKPAGIECVTCSKDLCNGGITSPKSEPPKETDPNVESNNTSPKFGPSVVLLSVPMTFLLFVKFTVFE